MPVLKPQDLIQIDSGQLVLALPDYTQNLMAHEYGGAYRLHFFRGLSLIPLGMSGAFVFAPRWWKAQRLAHPPQTSEVYYDGDEDERVVLRLMQMELDRLTAGAVLAHGPHITPGLQPVTHVQGLAGEVREGWLLWKTWEG